MTRVTNFGQKRKYLEAGFTTELALPSNEQPASEANISTDRDVRPMKKRKRIKEPKTSGADKQKPGGITPEGEKGAGGNDKVTSSTKRARMTRKHGPGGTKSIAINDYKRRTGHRRLKRMSNRRAETVCFACREKGHAAKHCPKAAGDSEGKDTNAAVGMCYRCGSARHMLSRCKASGDPLNPLPFASCFVCLGKGHLASACPQNKERGIYPNGGSCKLCGEKTHLAKDCSLRKKDASGIATTTVFGTGSGAGADEDDFHIFKRKNAEVSTDENKESRRRKQLDVKAGLLTGTVKVFGEGTVSSRPKKIVFF